jgi:hypothetical protein
MSVSRTSFNRLATTRTHDRSVHGRRPTLGRTGLQVRGELTLFEGLHDLCARE